MTVSCMAKHFGGDFFVFAPVVVPPMLRVLKSSKGVMYGAVNEAMIDIVDHCQSVELVGLLCNASEDKHPSVRENVMRYVARVFDSPNASSLNEDITPKVEEALRRTVSDASGPVRTEARVAFHNYKRVFPVEAALFLASLDSSLQKKLETAPKQQEVRLEKSNSVRDRILNVRSKPLVLPIAVQTSVVSPAHVGVATDATPLKSLNTEPMPTPVVQGIRRVAEVVHGNSCPPGTPVADLNISDMASPSMTLHRVAETLNQQYPSAVAEDSILEEPVEGNISMDMYYATEVQVAASDDVMGAEVVEQSRADSDEDNLQLSDLEAQDEEDQQHHDVEDENQSEARPSTDLDTTANATMEEEQEQEEADELENQPEPTPMLEHHIVVETPQSPVKPTASVRKEEGVAPAAKVAAAKPASRLGAAQRRPAGRSRKGSKEESSKENVQTSKAKAVPLKKKEFTPIAKRTRNRRAAAAKNTKVF